MSVTDFIAAVKGMVALRPDIRERIVALAPKMTDEQRSAALEELKPSYEEISKANAELVDVLDEEIADLTSTEKKIIRAGRAEEEQKDKDAADNILNDESSTDDTSSSFLA